MTLLLAGAATASAQTVTITSPTANQRIKAGADFATDVIGNPWDQTDRADFSADPSDNLWWSGFGQSGGTLNGVTASVNGYVDSQFKVLNRGFYGAVHPLNEISGVRFPIDTSTYTRLSFKLKTSSSPAAVTNVYWFRTMTFDPANSSFPGGDSFGVKFAGQTVPGASKIFTVDLPGTPQAGLPWGGAPVLGLRLGLTNSAAGNSVQYDWIRLTNGADVLPITWTSSVSSGTWTITATEGSSTQFNPDGTVYTIASGLTGSTRSFNFQYGVLPPGTYTLRIANSGGASATQTFIINDPPRVRVTSPDYTGGADFATAVIGDRWDLANAADVDLGQFGFTARPFRPPAFTPSPTRCPRGYFGDPQVWLLNGYIDKVQQDRRGTLSLPDVFTERGSAQRHRAGFGRAHPVELAVQFGDRRARLDHHHEGHAGVARPQHLHHRSRRAERAIRDGGLELDPAAELWSAGKLMNLFRIDPHEFADARGFDLANVKIGAINESSGNFTLAYDYYAARPSTLESVLRHRPQSEQRQDPDHVGLAVGKRRRRAVPVVGDTAVGHDQHSDGHLLHLRRDHRWARHARLVRQRTDRHHQPGRRRRRTRTAMVCPMRSRFSTGSIPTAVPGATARTAIRTATVSPTCRSTSAVRARCARGCSRTCWT